MCQAANHNAKDRPRSDKCAARGLFIDPSYGGGGIAVVSVVGGLGLDDCPSEGGRPLGWQKIIAVPRAKLDAANA